MSCLRVFGRSFECDGLGNGQGYRDRSPSLDATIKYEQAGAGIAASKESSLRLRSLPHRSPVRGRRTRRPPITHTSWWVLPTFSRYRQ